jgi:hypothetical protein
VKIEITSNNEENAISSIIDEPTQPVEIETTAVVISTEPTTQESKIETYVKIVSSENEANQKELLSAVDSLVRLNEDEDVKGDEDDEDEIKRLQLNQYKRVQVKNHLQI